MGANHKLQELFKFLKRETNQNALFDFCATKRINWKFISESSPHFGGLWESALKGIRFI